MLTVNTTAVIDKSTSGVFVGYLAEHIFGSSDSEDIWFYFAEVDGIHEDALLIPELLNEDISRG